MAPGARRRRTERSGISRGPARVAGPIFFSAAVRSRRRVELFDGAERSSPMNTSHDPDVIVIGAGLAGLTAALNLQHAGRKTLVLERLDRAGGLCGMFDHEGHAFTIGCNDFGGGL